MNLEFFYPLIGKYIYLFNILETKLKDKFGLYFSLCSERSENHKLISTIKTLLFLQSKADLYHFNQLKISTQAMDLTDVEKISINSIRTIQILKLHEVDNLSNDKFNLLDFNVYKKKGNQVNMRSALLKLNELRNKLAHPNHQILENLVSMEVSNSMVREYVSNENILECNIYWIENIIIPFLDLEDIDKNNTYEIKEFSLSTSD
ncbi:hypothetical protein BN85408440 [Alteracholeplasma palmae J233]|uniref:Uncharacterized protein n=1 Tax=Alteracholeplasma palmae (strain ATCC 49389 / J233) TaxID=1318466 RepID=U4KRT5_ALTPJ|nr:hypothetical protein [Alteracholeplasma palmae]CCV64421.1 hypothetical protein BN85408440 [Alteracholeplasma palmae J233]